MKTVFIDGIEYPELCDNCQHCNFYYNEQTVESISCRKHNRFMYVRVSDDRKCKQFKQMPVLECPQCGSTSPHYHGSGE
jgi:hypothetical protein